MTIQNLKIKKKVTLSIIIVNFNTKELLKKCIESVVSTINHQPLAIGLEVIVVDNSSDKRQKLRNSGEIKKLISAKRISQFLNFKIILNDENLGFSKANNQGIKEASGEYILLLNSDTEVKKGAIEKLVNYLEENNDVAAVSPQLLNQDGSKQIPYFLKLPTWWRILIYHNFLLRKLFLALRPLKQYLVTEFKNYPFEVEQLPATALLARRDVFEKTGGLDEDYFFFFEDVDWCYRVKEMNLGKLVIVPFAEVIHIGGGSWEKWLKKDSFGFYKNHFSSLLLFVKKHYPRRLWQFKLALVFTFLINSFVHFLTLNFKKLLVQVKLAGWVLGY